LSDPLKRVVVEDVSVITEAIGTLPADLAELLHFLDLLVLVAVLLDALCTEIASHLRSLRSDSSI
jgi:hypothetical protein